MGRLSEASWRGGDPMMAPHGVYRCKAENETVGDDEWVAIACETSWQWDALCEATGHPEEGEAAR